VNLPAALLAAICVVSVCGWAHILACAMDSLGLL
jgi:hypothetical protein